MYLFPIVPSYCHLQHHRHTNDPDKDPDFWTAKGPSFLLPLRWMTVEASYYITYLPMLNSRPWVEAMGTLLQLTAEVIAIWWGCSHGYHSTVLWAWLVPGRLANALLAWSFDYLPHRPHTVTRAQDAVAATRVTSLVGAWTAPLTWPLLHQNYHNIHHFWPFVPFYMYDRVWHAFKGDLMALGTVIHPIWGAPVTKLQD